MAAEAPYTPKDAQIPPEGERQKLTVPKADLKRRSLFAFQSLDPDMLASISGSNFRRSLFNRRLPEVVDVEGELKLVDGFHRVEVYPDDDVPVDNITAEVFSGQTSLTSEQYLAYLRLRLGKEIKTAPERMALNYISEWNGLLKEVAGESSGLAAIVLLGRRDLEDAPTAVVRSKLRKSPSPLLGESADIKEKVIDGIMGLHHEITATDQSYDTIVLKAFQAVASLTDSPESRALRQRQIYGLFTLGQVRRKITEDGADEEIRAGRYSQLTPLLIDAISASTDNIDENLSFRDALLHPSLSFDDLVEVLTPPEGDAPDKEERNSISKRLDIVKAKINENLCKKEYGAQIEKAAEVQGKLSELTESDREPSGEVLQIMRNLAGREVLSEGQVTDIVGTALPLQQLIDETTTFIAELPEFIDTPFTPGEVTQWTQGLAEDLQSLLNQKAKNGITRVRSTLSRTMERINGLRQERLRSAEESADVPATQASASFAPKSSREHPPRPAHQDRPARPAADRSEATSVAGIGEPVVLHDSTVQDGRQATTVGEQDPVDTQGEIVKLHQQIEELIQAGRLRDQEMAILRDINQGLGTGNEAQTARTLAERIVGLLRENTELKGDKERLISENAELTARVEDLEEDRETERRTVSGDLTAGEQTEIVPDGEPTRAQLLATVEELTEKLGKTETKLAATEAKLMWWDTVPGITALQKEALISLVSPGGKARFLEEHKNIDDEGFRKLISTATQIRNRYFQQLREAKETRID